MQRRTFMILLGGAATRPFAAGAQTSKVPRIGYLTSNLALNPHLAEAFRQGLGDLGYIEGRDIVIEYRSAESKLDRFPTLAAELVALRVDIIVAANTLAAVAAKQATATIPVVFAGPADPITSGIVASLAHPGSNVTGLSSLGPELVGKCLELLKEAVPGVNRVAALWHRDYPERTESDILMEADAAARALGLRLHFVEAQGGPENFAEAFSRAAQAGAEALTVLPSVLFISERGRLVDLAANHRLPAVYPTRDFVDDGGLMSYGALWTDIYRRAALFVDKILHGAKPADLPVEQPTKFELVINLKTAKALGLTVPQALLARADEVIE
jgi:ABC-type uncharacterized transport system substrate-binding protein